MERKKEDSQKVKIRVKRYLKSHKQILITGLSKSDAQSFIKINGMEKLSHRKKLMKLVEFWNKVPEVPVSNKKTELGKYTISAPITSNTIPGYQEPDYEIQGIQPENKMGTLFKGKIIPSFPKPGRR